MYIVFGRHNCRYCIDAQQLLTQRRLNFKFYDITTAQGQQMYPSYRSLVPLTHTTVPIVFLERNFIGGFTELQKIV